MPAPSVRATGTVATGTSGTITPGNPTHQTNDILLMIIGSSANASASPSHSTPSGGWALLGSTGNNTGTIRSATSVFWKRAASGAESNPSSTVTPTGSTAVHHSAVVISIQNAILSGNPYEGASGNQTAGASTLALTLTTSGADRLAFLCSMHADNVATGVTENSATYGAALVATDDATGIDGFLGIFRKTAASAGSHGATVTFTSGGTSVGISGQAFAIKPETAQTVNATGFSHATTYGTPSLQLVASPTGFSEAAAYGTPALHQQFSPTGHSETTTFGAPDIEQGAAGQQVDPAGLLESTTFGNPTMQPGNVNVNPTGHVESTAYGTPTLQPGNVNVNPTGHVESTAYGLPTLHLTVGPAGHAETTAFGSPEIAISSFVFPTGHSETTTFGSPTMQPGGVQIDPSGILDSSAFGAPTLQLGGVQVDPAGILEATAFGAADAYPEELVFPTGHVESTAYGTPSLQPGNVNVSATGFASAVAFGSPALTVSLHVAPLGFESATVAGEAVAWRLPYSEGLMENGGTRAVVLNQNTDL